MDSDVMTWISSGKNYDKGIEILEQRGASGALIRILRLTQSDYTRQKLYEELMKLNNAEPVKTKEKEVIIKPLKKPEYLIFREKHKGDLFAHMNVLHGKLKIQKTPKTRKKCAALILELEQKINEIWKEIDYWNEHGKLMPTEKPKTKLNNLQMAKRIANLQHYIRRDKNKRNNEAVAEWIKEKESLEQILAGSQ